MSTCAALRLPNLTRKSFVVLSLLLVSTSGLHAQTPEPPPDDLPPITTESPAGPQPEPQIPKGADKYRIEKGLSMFAGIKDDAILPWTDTGPRELADAPADRMEERAYDEVLRHARQFTTEELEAHARRDILPKDLYTNGRLTYKLDLIYFEGRLLMLRKGFVSEILRQSGVTDVYEAWIFPNGSIEPICVFLTELPPGLSVPASPNQTLNRWVAIAGYYFKTMRYEANQLSREEKGEHRIKRAPILMGRSLTLLEEPESAGMSWRKSFMPLVVGGAAIMAFTIIGLSWYFRRGDNRVQQELNRKLETNPFTNE